MHLSFYTLRRCSLTVLALLPGLSLAQDFSIDGNRWYEIEISIFSQQALSVPFPEAAPPTAADISYPDRLTRLKTLLDALAYDFADAAAALSPPEPAGNPASSTRYPLWYSPGGGSEIKAEPAVVLGPEPALEQRSFRLPDPQRDAFLALGDDVARFSRHNDRIQNSGNRRLLAHQVWRQPLLNKSQASAVAVTGGERYGDHYELEGSVTLSLNGNRVNIDAQLWFMRFATQSEEDDGLDWDIPLSPRVVAEGAVEAVPDLAAMPVNLRNPNSASAATALYRVSDVSVLSEQRDMISNNLHYLDHPALGVLVEVRPYQLPERKAAP